MQVLNVYILTGVIIKCSLHYTLTTFFTLSRNVRIYVHLSKDCGEFIMLFAYCRLKFTMKLSTRSIFVSDASCLRICSLAKLVTPTDEAAMSRSSVMPARGLLPRPLGPKRSATAAGSASRIARAEGYSVNRRRVARVRRNFNRVTMRNVGNLPSKKSCSLRDDSFYIMESSRCANFRKKLFNSNGWVNVVK